MRVTVKEGRDRGRVRDVASGVVMLKQPEACLCCVEALEAPARDELSGGVWIAWYNIGAEKQ